MRNWGIVVALGPVGVGRADLATGSDVWEVGEGPRLVLDVVVLIRISRGSIDQGITHTS
jgi:hypothetical protein